MDDMDDKIVTSFRVETAFRDDVKRVAADLSIPMGDVLKRCFYQVYGGDIVTDSQRLDWLFDHRNKVALVSLPVASVAHSRSGLRRAIDILMRQHPINQKGN